MKKITGYRVDHFHNGPVFVPIFEESELKMEEKNLLNVLVKLNRLIGDLVELIDDPSDAAKEKIEQIDLIMERLMATPEEKRG